MTATVITILVKDGNCVDWIDLDLPTPTSVKYVSRYSADYWNDQTDETPYKLTYTINGYFGTRRSKQYLHDIASRIAYTLDGTYEVAQVSATTAHRYKLSRFEHLDRPPSFNRHLEINAMGGSRNEIFHALRHKAYQMHRTNTLNLEALTAYGNQITNSSDHVKYLAPNVFKWVEENYEGRQSIMTRSEAGLNASTIKATKMKNRILSLLRSDLFTFDSLSDASRKLAISRITFKKYLEIHSTLQEALESYRTTLTPYVQLVYTGIEEVLKTVRGVKKWVLKEVLLKSILPVTIKDNEVMLVFNDTT